jgi:hypothetical protein
MAITTFVLRFNSNANMPTPSPGDIIHCIYDMTIVAAANTYPAGGEPIDFSTEFAEVHSVVADLAVSAPVLGQADAVGGQIPVFQRAAGAPGLNTGFIRFYRGPTGVGNLPEVPVAAYANDLGWILTVHGRAITDSQ